MAMSTAGSDARYCRPQHPIARSLDHEGGYGDTAERDEEAEEDGAASSSGQQLDVYGITAADINGLRIDPLMVWRVWHKQYSKTTVDE